MPLDKAGRLIASLARNATYEKRVRQDMKKKAELAFDQLEAELMAAIKQHPELAGELHDVLARAREKVLGGWRRLTSKDYLERLEEPEDREAVASREYQQELF